LPAFGRWLIIMRPDRPGGTLPMITSPNLSPEMQRGMLRRMLTIRRFEERASDDYLAGKIYGVVSPLAKVNFMLI
jgi:TPP-dependent pyruvate/acetoin dehydrogenase alpha subunit